MDNTKNHQGEILKKLIEKAGAKLLYLSPYSPYFSPTEIFYSKFKFILKKTTPKTYKDLINGIANATITVNQENIIS